MVALSCGAASVGYAACRACCAWVIDRLQGLHLCCTTSSALPSSTSALARPPKSLP